MSRSAKIREQLITSFRAELSEHVQTMTDGLLALEQGRVAEEQRQPTLETIFRAAHSLKGAARVVNVTVIEQMAHSLEGVLDAMQQGTIELTAELFTACYRALDAIQAVQAAYEAGETTPPMEAIVALADLEGLRSRPQAAATPKKAGTPPSTPDTAAASAPAVASPSQDRPAATEDTIRVSVAKLDALMAQLSELLVIRVRAEQRLAQMRQFQEFLASWQKEWSSVRSAYGRLVQQDLSSSAGNGGGRDFAHLLDYAGASQERLQRMNALADDLLRQYANDTAQMSLAIDGLEEEIKRARMLPLNTIAGPFGRMVRDLAQEAGKEAVLEITGGETELDKQVLEQIKDPLIHLLRNAIDHGIEPPDRREALGKPRTGKVTLTAEQLGQDVVVSVSDDGAGLDVEAIRRAVARQGKLDAQSLSAAELEELIFTERISTSPIVTDISGRGIGLSVVRRNVESIRGRIDVDWRRGQGVAFTMSLPLTLLSTHGLLVCVADQWFIIPLNDVEYLLVVGPEDIFSLEGHDAILHGGRPITLVRLDDVLGLPRVGGQGSGLRTPVVVVTAAERRMAFAVDELMDEQEVVVKGLGKQLVRVGGVAGATVMGSGEVVLILNVADLIRLAAQGERRSVFAPMETAVPPAPQARRRILIVDDSITTRTLEKNILEAVGYAVALAIDGEEALSAIATDGLPALIVSDILMPRMDGFELTQRIKSNERTADVPVILVSSLDSPADKARGIEVGADAYIVKSRFDQSNLLETIEQLI